MCGHAENSFKERLPFAFVSKATKWSRHDMPACMALGLDPLESPAPGAPLLLLQPEQNSVELRAPSRVASRAANVCAALPRSWGIAMNSLPETKPSLSRSKARKLAIQFGLGATVPDAARRRDASRELLIGSACRLQPDPQTTARARLLTTKQVFRCGTMVAS